MRRGSRRRSPSWAEKSRDSDVRGGGSSSFEILGKLVVRDLGGKTSNGACSGGSLRWIWDAVESLGGVLGDQFSSLQQGGVQSGIHENQTTSQESRMQGHQLLERTERGQPPPRTASEQPNNSRPGALRARQELREEGILQKLRSSRVQGPPGPEIVRSPACGPPEGKPVSGPFIFWRSLSLDFLACCRFVQENQTPS